MHGLLSNASSAHAVTTLAYAFVHDRRVMDDERGIDGGRVRDLRKDRGWTQKDLERESGVAQSTLSRIERGGSHGSYAATLRALARAFGCTEAYLTGDAEAPGAELRVVRDGGDAPTIGARPEAAEIARELADEQPALAPYIEKVMASGSMNSLDIPLTRAALETLARVVQSHGRRRGR